MKAKLTTNHSTHLHKPIQLPMSTVNPAELHECRSASLATPRQQHLLSWQRLKTMNTDWLMNRGHLTAAVTVCSLQLLVQSAPGSSGCSPVESHIRPLTTIVYCQMITLLIYLPNLITRHWQRWQCSIILLVYLLSQLSTSITHCQLISHWHSYR